MTVTSREIKISDSVSNTISNEFITLIAKKTRLVIVNEIKKAGYYSISIDSTPGISHIDQLTIIIRYVTCNGPVERFFNFY